MLVIFSALIGAAVGKAISIFAYIIPHRMELDWHKEAQEALALDPDEIPFDPDRPAPKASISEIFSLSILCAALFGIVAWLAPAGVIQASLFCAFLLGLVLLSWIDARTYLLPDVLVYPLLWVGLLANLNGLFVPLDQAVIGAVAGYSSFWFIAKLFAVIRKKEGMGHGDFKLLAAIGAWLGWMALPWVVILACVVGIFIAVGRAALSKRIHSGPIPFGPSLAVSGALLGFLHLTQFGGVTGFLRWLNLA